MHPVEHHLDGRDIPLGPRLRNEPPESVRPVMPGRADCEGLLLLKQSIDADFIVTQGNLVDCGTFAGCLHRHEIDRALDLGVTFGSLSGWQAPEG